MLIASMTTCVRSHPELWPGRKRTRRELPLVSGPVTAHVLPTTVLPETPDRFVVAFIMATTILTGLCVGMSIVTFFLRLIQHLAALIG